MIGLAGEVVNGFEVTCFVWTGLAGLVLCWTELNFRVRRGGAGLDRDGAARNG